VKLAIDANVAISALIADSKTRELIVTLDSDLLTPAFVHDKIGNYDDLIVEKSGMDPNRVIQFQYIDVVPANEFYPAIESAAFTSPDSHPIGAQPGAPDSLIVVIGLHERGVTLSPVTARAVRSLVTDEPTFPAESLRVTRFNDRSHDFNYQSHWR
jgi:hypothetical protein